MERIQEIFSSVESSQKEFHKTVKDMEEIGAKVSSFTIKKGSECFMVKYKGRDIVVSGMNTLDLFVSLRCYY